MNSLAWRSFHALWEGRHREVPPIPIEGDDRVVAASSPAPSVTQANLANLNSAAAEVPMNAAVTSQIYTSLTDTTEASHPLRVAERSRAVVNRRHARREQHPGSAMPAQRLSMRQVREVLRLKHVAGHSERRIAATSALAATRLPIAAQRPVRPTATMCSIRAPQ